MSLPQPKIRAARTPKEKKFINVLIMGPEGYRTRTVEAIKEVSPGAFLTKSLSGNAYEVTDAITGLAVGRGAKTQSETIEKFRLVENRYKKIKSSKSNAFSRGYAVNKKTKDGWKPVKTEFPTMEVRSYEKDKKGGKYVKTSSGKIPFFSDKDMQSRLQDKASSRTGLQTIRKVYGTKEGGKTNITKIVEYSKGYKLQKNSTFRPGKRTKGERLLSKTFLK